MIYISVIAVFFILVGFWLAPHGQMTHAAISANVLLRKRLFPFAGMYSDSKGHRINMEHSVVAKAYGPSCEEFGIPDGAVVIAARLSDDAAHADVAPGDIVIINSEIADGTKPQRFRCVDYIDGDVVHFRSSDREYRSKPFKDLVGKVEYVST